MARAQLYRGSERRGCAAREAGLFNALRDAFCAGPPRRWNYDTCALHPGGSASYIGAGAGAPALLACDDIGLDYNNGLDIVESRG
jgi:hypothetical protein